MRTPISSKRITWVLVIIIASLTLASFGGQYYMHFLGDDPLWVELAMGFNVDREKNIPTWFQTVSLFSCSLLLAVIASAERAVANRYARHWVILALVFLYLSVDEFVLVHERIGSLRLLIPAHGAFYQIWVIPYGIVVLIIALAYLKFLFYLPVRTRFLFVVAGTLYVGGALGMEMVHASFIDSHADKLAAKASFTDVVLATIEEFLEMSGIMVFINGLISYLALHGETAQVTEGIRSRAHATPPSADGRRRRLPSPKPRPLRCDRNPEPNGANMLTYAKGRL